MTPPKDPADETMQEKQKTKILRHDERPTNWSLTKNEEKPYLDIEATTEFPVMMKALGSPVCTKHPYNIYRDIMTEPDALQATFSQIPEAVKKVSDELVTREITRIVGLGMGTSQFVAQAAAPALWKYAGICMEDQDSVELLTYDQPYDWEHTAFFLYSGSGSTFDTISAAKKITDKGAYSVTFTSVAGSPLTKISSDTIACAGGFDTGGGDTFHYATRLAASIDLAIEVGLRKDSNAHDYSSLRDKLHNVPALMRDRLPYIDARAESIAGTYHGIRSVIIVGAGPNWGTAEEMALKFDEMAHLPAKAMVPTRHLHGALGLTHEDILTILLVPKNTPSLKWIDQIANVTHLLKCPAMAIVWDDEQEIASTMDYVIRLPVEDEILYSVMAVPAIQVQAYWFAVKSGQNPDCQRSEIPKYARVWNYVLPPGGH